VKSTNKVTAQLWIPEQDLDCLSFAPHHPRKFEAWLESLPMANLGEASRLLYLAIRELNRVSLDPQIRLQLLELLRPRVHKICSALGKHFLHQALVLPPKAAKVANLAQALQNYLATGYKIIIIESMPRCKSADGKKIIAKSIHRALVEMSDTLLRSYQLYFPAPKNQWWSLNQLYLCAEQSGVATMSVSDPQRPKPEETTVQQAFLRTILLATSKPNQLRQADLKAVDDLAWLWACKADLSEVHHGHDTVFILSLVSDSEPIHASLLSKDRTPTELVRYVDCRSVVTVFRGELIAADEKLGEKLGVEEPVSLELCRHLVNSWGKVAERAFSRGKREGKIEVCVGFSSIHYFLSNKQEFSTFLTGEEVVEAVDEDINPFLAKRRSLDESGTSVWDSVAGTSSDGESATVDRLTSIKLTSKLAKEMNAELPKKESKHRSYQCDLVNSSPGGYCLSLQGEVLHQIKTGELLGVREGHSGNWNIAVIRWVKQSKIQGVRVGVELLAPNAQAVATQLVQKTGKEQNYLRAFLIPELKAIGQAATLLTLKLGYRVGAKVIVKDSIGELPTRLTKCNESTSSFMQFQFSYVGKAPADIDSQRDQNREVVNGSSSEFSSIWKEL